MRSRAFFVCLAAFSAACASEGKVTTHADLPDASLDGGEPLTDAARMAGSSAGSGGAAGRSMDASSDGAARDGGAANDPAAERALAASVAPPIRPSQLLQTLEPFQLPPASFDMVHPDGSNSPGHVGLMHSFASSLGSDVVPDDCNGCHVDWENEAVRVNDQTRIARHMWDDILGTFELADGQPFYCDSCHQGKRTFLDRKDPKAVMAWMQLNMIDKLQRRDGKPHDCDTCHGNASSYDGLLEVWSNP